MKKTEAPLAAARYVLRPGYVARVPHFDRIINLSGRGMRRTKKNWILAGFLIRISAANLPTSRAKVVALVMRRKSYHLF